MKHRIKKTLQIAGLGLGMLIALAVLGCVWYYATPFTAVKARVGLYAPLPVMMVGSSPVWVSQMQSRIEAFKAQAQEASFDESAARAEVLNAIARDRRIAVIASRHSVAVSPRELDDYYQRVKIQTEKDKPGQVDALLREYGMSEARFLSEVLRPTLLSDALHVWYNKQRDLNAEAYKTADALFSRAQAEPEAFSSLAESFSQDKDSAALQGDLGFITENDLLPEFRQAIDGKAAGSIVLASSRQGLHILKIEHLDAQGEGGLPRAHLRQIFIRTGDYDQWLAAETKSVPIRKLIKNP